MRRFAPSLLLAACAAASAAAPDWRMPLPGTPLTALDRAAYRCAPDGPRLRCQPLEAIPLPGIPVLEQTLVFRDARLERMSVAVDMARFQRLRQHLTQALGPGEEHTERLRAGMGGIFPNTVLIWRKADRCVLLEQHFERVAQCGFSVMDCQALASLLAQRERQRVRGLRDF